MIRLAAQLRRADRFTRMAFIAAKDAWDGAKDSLENIAPERIGLILSSGFGPHCRGFKFLDGILDEGDMAASPTDFSHSVHGAASAYISRLLGIRGPALNITDFEIGFEEAIRMAQCWLAEKACDRVLVGAVEELGEVLLNCAERMLGEDQSISPAEGAVFLILGPDQAGGIGHVDADAELHHLDLLVIEDPSLNISRGREPRSGTTTQEKPELPPRVIKEMVHARRTVWFTPVFGNSSSSTAFSVLARC